MKVDFHVHTRRSVDAVHSPRQQMVKKARDAGINAIAIPDHSRLFSTSEAQRLSRESGLVVIPGIEGGNIAVRRHWIALGIERHIMDTRTDLVLESIPQDSGVSVAPHPHSQLGYGNYAGLGFDADETIESILESVRRGLCRPEGSTIPFLDLFCFYSLCIRDRILRQPVAALSAARQVIRDVRRVRAYESSCRNCRMST